MFAVLLPFTVLLALVLNESTTIDLGGPRKAIAVVKKEGDSFNVTVEFIPVKCFDPTLNRRLSLDKARQFVALSISHSLGNSTRRLQMIGYEVSSVSVDERKMKVQAFIQEVQSSQPETSRPEKGLGTSNLTSSNLLSVDADLKSLVEGTFRSLAEDWEHVSATEQRTFAEAVYDAELLTQVRLEQLRNEIKNCKLLLKTEQDESLRAVAEGEEKLLGSVRRKVQEATKGAKDE